MLRATYKLQVMSALARLLLEQLRAVVPADLDRICTRERRALKLRAQHLLQLLMDLFHLVHAVDVYGG